MTTSNQIAYRFRDVTLNGELVAGTNFKKVLSDVSFLEATKKVASLNTIAALTFHIDYYIAGVIKVLEGGTLDIHDKFSFNMAPIVSESDWKKLREKLLLDALRLAELIEEMPEEKWKDTFVHEKYGNFRHNIELMIEHGYYHLGQIVLIKKLVREM